MANIATVHIKGFQSHVDTRIDLTDGLNVITGPSDAGKTAVLRAIRWVAFGEPSGEAFVNAEVGEAEVVLELDDGVTITKRRRRGKTLYALSTIPEPFEKAEVPDEVVQALGIRKHSFGDIETALNFAYQLEAPYIISETPSYGAKILGKLAGTEAVDLAIRDIGKDTYAARDERRQAEKEIERIEGDLLQFADLDEVRSQLQAAEYLVEEAEQRYNKREKLRSLVYRVGLANDKLTEAAQKLDSLAVVPALADDMRNIENAQRRYDKLLALYSKLGTTQARVEELTQTLTNYTGLDDAREYVRNCDETAARLSTLSSIAYRFKDNTYALNEIVDMLHKTDDLPYVRTLVQESETNGKKLETLQTLAQRYQAFADYVHGAEQKLERLQHVEQAAGILAQVQADEQHVERLTMLQYRHANAWGDVKVKTTELRQVNDVVATLEADLSAAWEEAGGRCPLCDQPLQGGTHSGH